MTRLRLALLCSAFLACAPSHPAAYSRSIAAGERAESAGRFGEAIAEYDRAAAAAVKPHDADHARFLAASMAREARDFARAHDRFEAIAKETPPGEYAGRAAYALADLEIAHGDPASGFEALERFVHAFPDDGLAPRALERLVAHTRATLGQAKLLAYLEQQRATLAGTPIEGAAIYLTAGELETQGDHEKARDLYLEVATRFPYPFGPFFDDALYRAAGIDAARGREGDAVHDLERLLAERETTTIVGTYERPKYVPAMFKLASLYQGALHDHTKARAVYHRIYTEFLHSTWRDDALWKEADLASADGDKAEACRVLATLVRDFPDSRYVACARERCPSVAAPSTSRAPKACRAYIERGVTPDPG